MVIVDSTIKNERSGKKIWRSYDLQSSYGRLKDLRDVNNIDHDSVGFAACRGKILLYLAELDKPLFQSF